MRRLQDLPIKQKLLAITLVTIAASLLLAGTGVVVSDSLLFRSGMKRDIAALAQIVGDNSTAALDFDDARVAGEILGALKARPHIVAACIYKKNNSILAQYTRPNASSKCPPAAAFEEIRFTSGELISSHPIEFQNRPLGTLVMVYDLDEVSERRMLYIEIVLAILVVSSIVAFLLSSRLRDIIATPMTQLASAATSVSHTGDYGIRVARTSNDEIGILVDAFNEMLSGIQSRDIEVQTARYSLQTTLNSIGDAVIATDTRGHIVFSNPVARSLLRLQEHELENRPIHEVFHIVDEFSRSDLEAPVYRVLRNGAISGLANHTVLIAADGSEFPIDESAAPIRDAQGEMKGVVLIFRDVSARRATQRLLETQAVELQESAARLKEADQRKDQFLAMLAHELRNPLAPIRNAVHVLRLVDNAESRNWASELIERQTLHLTRLVDDLLDVSRITRGRVTLHHERLEVATIVDRAIEMVRPLIDARKHQLKVTIPEGSIPIWGDITRLVQVFGNLLNNAAKFTGDGGLIQLEVEREGKHVVVRVRDNGIGLPATLVPHIFDLFTQGDRSLDRSQGGLGIGLTLVRSLVELHEGTVEARSGGVGCGSEFSVRLPLLPAEAVEIPQSTLPEPKTHLAAGLRILILEDNIDSAEMLRFMLKLNGHDVQIASDGTVALELAQEFRPQVILCDIGLPGMNGFEVAVRLRAQSEFKQTRLIAISGYGQEEDLRRSKDAGFDYHLTKPVEPDLLANLLSSI